MTTLITRQEKELNKKINEYLRNPHKVSDFANPIYTITDHCDRETITYTNGFKSHEEAAKYYEENEKYKTPTEMEYIDDSGFGRGKFRYSIKISKPKSLTFKSRGQAVNYLKQNPHILDSWDRHEKEFEENLVKKLMTKAGFLPKEIDFYLKHYTGENLMSLKELVKCGLFKPENIKF